MFSEIRQGKGNRGTEIYDTMKARWLLKLHILGTHSVNGSNSYKKQEQVV